MTSVQVDWTVHKHDLPVIAATLLPKARAMVAKAALDVAAQAQGKAPVDTGTLRSSIQATQLSADAWRVVVGADYGIYVEYGTVHNAAQPYFRPAVQAVRPVFVAALKGLLG